MTNEQADAPDTLDRSDWPWLAAQLRAWPDRRVHEERTMSIGALFEMAAGVVEHAFADSERPASHPQAVSREAVLREAASIAYRVCAETRHVTLGDKVSSAILAALANTTTDQPITEDER